MKQFFALLTSITLLSACNKNRDCGCVPPPAIETSWKISGIRGGIAGWDKELTEEQKTTILIIKPNGTYTCTNSQTGVTISGTIQQTNFNSVYGNRPRYTFTPNLSMLNNEYHILVDNQSNTFIL